MFKLGEMPRNKRKANDMRICHSDIPFGNVVLLVPFWNFHFFLKFSVWAYHINLY